MTGKTPPSAEPRRVPLTTEMTAALRAQRERTGVSVPKLVRDHLDPKCGITERLIHCWSLGLLETLCPASYAHVVATWRALPDRDGAYVVYSPAIRAAMEAELTRTGIGIFKFVSGLSDVPDGLTGNKIRNFYSGNSKWLARAHAEYIIGKLKALPDRVSETLPLTPEILETLRAHVLRTGKGPSAILRAAHDRPTGLTGSIIHSWLSEKTATARKDHLDYVLMRYEGHQVSDRIDITGAMLAELRAQAARTGVGPHALLSGAKDKPTRLNGNTVQNWMRGCSRTTSNDQFNYVLARWRTLPDAGTSPLPRRLTACQQYHAALRRRPLKPHRPQRDTDTR